MVVEIGTVLKNPLFNKVPMRTRVLAAKNLASVGMTNHESDKLLARCFQHDFGVLKSALNGDMTRSIPSLRYEGPNTSNPLAFAAYDPDMPIERTTMGKLLNISIADWHAFRNALADPFGPGTIVHPWNDMHDPLMQAVVRQIYAFQIKQKVGFPAWCTHDYDVVNSGDGPLKTVNAELKYLTALQAKLQRQAGVQNAWYTCQLFAIPDYMDGAGTAKAAWPYERAIAQLMNGIDNAIKLGSQGWVFWGGREGVNNWINTRIKTDLYRLASLLNMTIKAAREKGFTGRFFIEPKGKEPTDLQYDTDVTTCLGFLDHFIYRPEYKGQFKYLKELMINLEPNHVSLGGRILDHDLQVAVERGMLGSIDINFGEDMIGWDEDKITNFHTAHKVMRAELAVRAAGGHITCNNIDAKSRRTSTNYPIDLMIGFARTADMLAIGTMLASMERRDPTIGEMMEARYSQGWGTQVAQLIKHGSLSAQRIAQLVLKNESSLQERPMSGKTELFWQVQDRPLIKAIVDSWKKWAAE